MYQIDNSTAAAAQPASTPAGSAGFFTDGNPAGGVAATIVPAEWLNAVMMELINVLVAGGVTPTKNTFNQVATAIRAIGKAPTVLADTGAANAYTAANVPALLVGTWVDNVVQRVKIANANTGASTYAPDGLTAIPIYGMGLQPLQGGELRAGGVAAMIRTTIAGVNSGNPICVLLECLGGTQQIPAATQSNHAVNMGQFLSSLATSGYVKIPTPSGTIIVQWGQTNGSTTSTDYKTYPVAFTVGAYAGCASYAGFVQQGFGNAFQPVSATQFLVTNQNSSGVPQNGLTNWIAIGK